MNIWYIHHYGGGPNLGSYDRPYHLGQAWLKQGHSPTNFVASFHHLLEGRTPLRGALSVGDVDYVAIPARSYGRNGLNRLLNIWDFSRNLYSLAGRSGHGLPAPEIVIASSPHPFTIFPAHRLARRYGAKLVFEIRDIWPLSMTEIFGTSPLHPFAQMCAFAERFALRNSDLIASVLPRADRYLAGRGYGTKPFVWVPNGIGAQEEATTLSCEESRATAAVVEQWRREGNIVIAHAGSLGKPNAIDLLLEAVAYGSAIGEARNCRILLMGRGQEEAALRSLTENLNLQGVHFSGRLPKSDVSIILKQVDIGYAGVRAHDRLYRYGVSLNKFADYFQAFLPVFLPIDRCGDPVSESGGGIARRAQTPEEVWNGLRELVAMPPQARRGLGVEGNAYMLREYDYDRIARRYVEAVERC